MPQAGEPPVEAAPVETAPAEAAPAETTPVEAVAADAAPIAAPAVEEPAFIEVWRPAGRAERRPHRPRRPRRQETATATAAAAPAPAAQPAEGGEAVAAAPAEAATPQPKSPAKRRRPRAATSSPTGKPAATVTNASNAPTVRVSAPSARTRAARAKGLMAIGRPRAATVRAASATTAPIAPSASSITPSPMAPAVGGGGRNKEPDPNSPFAKLAALKQQLERQRAVLEFGPPAHRQMALARAHGADAQRRGRAWPMPAMSASTASASPITARWCAGRRGDAGARPFGAGAQGRGLLRAARGSRRRAGALPGNDRRFGAQRPRNPGISATLGAKHGRGRCGLHPIYRYDRQRLLLSVRSLG